MEMPAASEHICRSLKRGRGNLETEAGETDSNESSDKSPSSSSADGNNAEIIIEPHSNSNVYIARDKDNVIKLVTRCISTGLGDESFFATFKSTCCKYRIWSPYQSKLAAALIKGVENIHITEGTKIIYLGAAFGWTVSYVADIVGNTGLVYAVETSRWAGRGLVALAQKRHNIVAIVEDATMPYRYRQRILDNVDFIFCDMMHEEQLRILILHARHFLKIGGHFGIMVPGVPQDASCSSAISRLQVEQLDTLEQISLQPYVHSQVMLLGVYNRTTPQMIKDIYSDEKLT